MYKNDCYCVYMQTRVVFLKMVLCLVARFLIYVHGAFVTRQCRSFFSSSLFFSFLTWGGGGCKWYRCHSHTCDLNLSPVIHSLKFSADDRAGEKRVSITDPSARTYPQ